MADNNPFGFLGRWTALVEKILGGDQIAPIEQVHEKVIAMIRTQFEKYNINATGKTIRSLEGMTTPNRMYILSKAQGAPFRTTQYGRAFGKMPPVNAIIEWIKAKGIGGNLDEKKRTSLAWAIAKTIEIAGTQRYRHNNTDVYSPALAKAIELYVAAYGARFKVIEQMK